MLSTNEEKRSKAKDGPVIGAALSRGKRRYEKRSPKGGLREHLFLGTPSFTTSGWLASGSRPRITYEVSPCAIYVLLNAEREVIYVGQTIKPTIRLLHHKKTFGENVTMRIVQNTFPMETPAEAERKWIRRFKDKGAILKNIQVPKVSQLYSETVANSAASVLGRTGAEARRKTLGKKGLSEQNRKAVMARWSKRKLTPEA